MWIAIAAELLHLPGSVWYTGTMSVQVAILQLLETKSYTRAEIADESGYKENSLRGPLAELTRNFLAIENRGKYSITQQGRDFLKMPVKLSKNHNPGLRLTPSVIKAIGEDPMCRVIWENRNTFIGYKAHWFLPIVYAYFLMTQTSQTEAAITWNVREANNDDYYINEAVMPLFHYFLDDEKYAPIELIQTGLKEKAIKKEAVWHASHREYNGVIVDSVRVGRTTPRTRSERELK